MQQQTRERDLASACVDCRNRPRKSGERAQSGADETEYRVPRRAFPMRYCLGVFFIPRKEVLSSATPRLCRMASLTRRLYPDVRGRDRPGDNGNAHRWLTKPGGRHRVTSVLKENLRYVDVLDVRLSRQTPPTNASTPAPGTELSAVVPLSSRCWIVIKV